jgi:hypothetical protein
VDASSVLELLAGLREDHERGTNPGLRLAHSCVELVAVSGAGIVLIDHQTNVSPLGMSDPTAAHVEELQFTFGEGPAFDAHDGGRAVLEPNLDAPLDGRWSAFASAAVDAGYLAAFAFPLRIGAARFGALDLYRDQRGDLDRDQLTDAISMSEIVTRAVIAVQANADPGDLAAELDGSDLRAQVHQAAGMVARQLDVPVADALVRLRAHAYARGQSINDVALDVLERRLRLE